MDFLKLIIVFSLTFSATIVSPQFLEDSRTNDIIYDCPEDPRNLQIRVYRSITINPIKGVVQEAIFRYPDIGETKQTIKCIKVSDLGNGEDAVIETGGIGFRHVTIRFRGMKNKESNFFIGIWEEKDKCEVNQT